MIFTDVAQDVIQERSRSCIYNIQLESPLIWKTGTGKVLPVPAWWNGRHNRLKICRSKGRASSSLAAGTIRHRAEGAMA